MTEGENNGRSEAESNLGDAYLDFENSVDARERKAGFDAGDLSSVHSVLDSNLGKRGIRYLISETYFKGEAAMDVLLGNKEPRKKTMRKIGKRIVSFFSNNPSLPLPSTKIEGLSGSDDFPMPEDYDEERGN